MDEVASSILAADLSALKGASFAATLLFGLVFEESSNSKFDEVRIQILRPETATLKFVAVSLT